MADRTTIERIAKILARANSDNEAEAEAALRGAYARMNRDGVTFTDLLELPEKDLYQDALVRLADLIVKDQESLSPSQKRTLYAEYLAKIVAKFSGASQSAGRGGESDRDQAEREREELKRAYEQRRQREEERRSTREPPRQERAPEPEPKRAEPGRPEPAFAPTFSVRNLLALLLGPNSFIICLFRFPKRAIELIFNAGIIGGIISFALFMISVVGYHFTESSILLWIYKTFFYSTILGPALIIFVTAYVLYEQGWYRVGPDQGRTDAISVIKDFGQFVFKGLLMIWNKFRSKQG